MKNHYQFLGVQPTASKEEIKAAYIKLSKKMHPDMNDGDHFFTELFKNINAAYQVLSNDTDRKKFDFELNNVALDYDFIKEKERKLHEKETLLVHRQMRRKLLIKGSVSLFTGLAIIALFSLSFDEKKVPETKLHIYKQDEVAAAPAVEDTVSTSVVAVAATSIQDNLMKQLHDAANNTELMTLEQAVTEKAEPVRAIAKQAVLPSAKKELNLEDMEHILHLVEQNKLNHHNASIGIRLYKSANSNVENAFRLAGFLQSKGYVIAGRETTAASEAGIHIDCSGEFISITVGTID